LIIEKLKNYQNTQIGYKSLLDLFDKITYNYIINNKGYVMLIVFEGIDGSGKSTQVRMLCEQFVERGYDIAVFSQPSLETKQQLMNKNVTEIERLMLLMADRAKVYKEIKEFLAPEPTKNKIVLLDRCLPSTFAYQWGVGKLPTTIDNLIMINTLATEMFPVEDRYCLFFNIPVEVASQRIAKRSGSDSLEEAKKLEQYNMYYQQFFLLDDSNKSLWGMWCKDRAIIGATLNYEEVAFEAGCFIGKWIADKSNTYAS
jgi:dTMP kinase